MVRKLLEGLLEAARGGHDLIFQFRGRKFSFFNVILNKCSRLIYFLCSSLVELSTRKVEAGINFLKGITTSLTPGSASVRVRPL